MSVENILEEIRGISTKKGPQCSVQAILTSIDGEKKAAMVAALGDSSIDSSAISKWLLKNGHDAKPHTLARHRRRECRCE